MREGCVAIVDGEVCQATEESDCHAERADCNEGCQFEHHEYVKPQPRYRQHFKPR